jgi:hypothetical protein
VTGTLASAAHLRRAEQVEQQRRPGQADNPQIHRQPDAEEE